MINSHIKIDINKYTNLRREFHKIPEIAYKEYKTKALIIENLKNLKNFNDYAVVTEIGDTGFFIDIFGHKKVPDSEGNYNLSKNLISFRADIDGLPFTDESDFYYKSQHEGRIHGCGHDGHITILIATLDYYLKNLDKIPENFGVRFLFQPAEEGHKGAINMIEGGCLNNVSEIFGLHNVTTFKIGEIGVIPGTIMARADAFEVHIKGRGGHASTPYKCCSPITTGVQIITAINQISSQEINNLDRHAIGIGCFNAGEAFNVIPEYGVIKGSVRSFNNQLGMNIMKRIKDVCVSIGKLNSCDVTVEDDCIGPCTVNHSTSSSLIQKIAMNHFELKTHDLPLMASEDFSCYLEKIPGCFFMLGMADETHKEYLHTTKYDFNDIGLEIGVEMFIRIVEEKISTQLI